jgi:ABC-type phosphate transport system substrate-binding protein
MSALAALSVGAGGTGSPKAVAQPPRSEHSVPGEPLAIVVNRSNPVNNLSLQDLRSIFLGERNYWPNGRRITLVLRDLGDPERRTIIHDLCGMSENQFRTHVLRGMFTGNILVSPKTLNTPAGVRRFIFNVPGAIGALRISETDGSIGVVRIDDLLPSDKGYELRVNPGPENPDE